LKHRPRGGTRWNIILAAAISVLSAAAIGVAWLAPAEKQLGDAVKLIYLHAGLVLVSMLLVTVVGIFGLLYLVTGREIFLAWAKPAKLVTLIFWTVYLLQSMLAMYLTWNRVVFNEPRFLMAASILAALAAIYLLSTVFEAPRVIASLNVVMGAGVWILVSQVGAVMHPTSNPISSSSSALIKVDSLLIFLFLLAAAAVSVTLAKRLAR
jgi:hypothetical protein